MYGNREEPNLSGKYIVLYNRDTKTEQSKDYGERELYDREKIFSEKSEALKFAYNNLPAVALRTPPLRPQDLEQSAGQYVVYAHHYGKYTTSCMGETDPMHTYDTLRCDQNQLEETVNLLAKEEKVEGIYAGIELKLFGDDMFE